MSTVSAPCAVCAGDVFAPVHPGTLGADEGDPAEYFSSSRTRVGYWPVVRCVRCGLVLSNPRDDDATLARVYARLADAAYDAEEANRVRTARAHLACVERRLPQRGALLDVGCATGLFVAQAHARGWRATGLEASAWAVARARERCPGATFVQALLEQAELPEGSFAAVTLWDVLEHVRSPAETLRCVRRWLAPDGWLFLNLPNAASTVARVMGPRWVLLLREHLWYFSPATLGRLLAQEGFELVRAEPNLVWFSLANIGSRLGQYPGALGRCGRALAVRPALRRLSLRFPIGEMTVAARRRVDARSA